MNNEQIKSETRGETVEMQVLDIIRILLSAACKSRVFYRLHIIRVLYYIYIQYDTHMHISFYDT